MKGNWIFFSAFVVVMLFGSVQGRAEEDVKAVLSGQISSTAEGSFSIVKRDQENNLDIKYDFTTDDRTVLINARKLSDIKPGDQVDVTYFQRAGKNIAGEVKVNN